MNFLKNIGGTEGNTQSSGNTVGTEAGGQNTMIDTAGKGGQSGGIMGGMNSMLGGGAAGEKNEGEIFQCNSFAGGCTEHVWNRWFGQR